MQVRKLKKRVSLRPTEPRVLMIYDEFQISQPEIDFFKQANRDRAPSPTVYATQAVVRGKGGKQRLIGYGQWAATGDPLKSAPKKFSPSQVLRRIVVEG